jgi:hypothetical protein
MSKEEDLTAESETFARKKTDFFRDRFDVCFGQRLWLADKLAARSVLISFLRRFLLWNLSLCGIILGPTPLEKELPSSPERAVRNVRKFLHLLKSGFERPEIWIPDDWGTGMGVSVMPRISPSFR